MRTRRIQSHLAALGLAASLLLAQPASVWATPPIEGDTLDFAASTDIGASTDGVRAAALGDLDGDGDLDAVTGSGTAEDFEIIVWQNDGTPFSGGWASSNVDNTSAAVRAVALGDLDNDGDLDLVVGTAFGGGDPEVMAYQNQGVPFAGGWTGPYEVGHASESVDSIALGDLDNDGDLDLIADDAHDISAMENDGDPFGGQWSAGNIAVAADHVLGVVLGDLDNDGFLDAVSVSEAGEDYEVTAWRNDTDPFGGLWVGTDVGASDSHSLGVALGDLDNDGDLDIASSGSDGVRLWQNDGDPFSGLWPGHLVPDSEPANKVALGDLDGDGDLDMASSHIGPLETRVWQNDGTPFGGPWTPSGLGAVANTVHSLALGDLDGDGDLDVVANTGLAPGFELIAWQNSHAHRNAAFAAQGVVAGSPDMDVMALAQGDLDGDGDVDVIAAGQPGAASGVVAWHNTGAPFAAGWPSSTLAPIAQTVGALAVGDLDNDGDLDVVTGSTADADFEIMAWENGFDPFIGPWDSGNVGAATDAIHSLALADLDNDGDLDIVAGAGTNAFGIVVWMNDGTPFDNPWIQNGVGDSPGNVWAVAVGDLDNDGYVDIISGSDAESDFEVMAWQNDGLPFAGLWAGADVGAENNGVHSLAAGDLDNDGDLDIMSGSMAAPNATISAWRNGGNPFGVLWPEFEVGGGTGHIYALQLGDLDDDGDLDLVSGAGDLDDYEVTAWENDGAPLSGVWPMRDIGATAGSVHGVALADLDHDGDLDVVSGSGADGASEVVAWKNIGGSAGLGVRTQTLEAPILNSNEEAVLRLAFIHNGDAGDDDLELNYIILNFQRPDCATPLNDAEANALADNLRVRLDDGDLVFETSDTLVADVGTLALNGGAQTVEFSDGDANAQVAVGGAKFYWVSLLTTSDATAQNPNSLCVLFDPDADALIEAKGTADYSASIQDTDLSRTGGVPIAFNVFVPVVVN